MGASVGHREHKHQKERGERKAEIAYHGAADPSHFEPYVGGHLHDGRPRYRLAERNAILKGFTVEPLLLPDGRLSDVSDHGRSAESGDPQP